jgi:hypothetical protein
VRALERLAYIGPRFDWVSALQPGAFINIDCRGLLLSDLRIIAAAEHKKRRGQGLLRHMPVGLERLDIAPHGRKQHAHHVGLIEDDLRDSVVALAHGGDESGIGKGVNRRLVIRQCRRAAAGKKECRGVRRCPAAQGARGFVAEKRAHAVPEECVRTIEARRHRAGDAFGNGGDAAQGWLGVTALAAWKLDGAEFDPGWQIVPPGHEERWAAPRVRDAEKLHAGG